jgi:ATP-dependent DNA helicase RecQ
VVEHKWGLFLELVRWAEGGSCRHDAILRYFGDEAEALAGCGICDVCTRLGSEADRSGEALGASQAGGAGDPEAVTLVVRKALSAVARIHGRYGLSAAVQLLRGAEDPRLLRAGLHETRTFGALQDRSEEWLLRLLRRCVTPGWVDFEGGDRPVALLTTEGAAVMRGERPAQLLLPPEQRFPRGGSVPVVRSAKRGAPVVDETLDDAGRARFEALRRWRLERARAESVPPYVVASDRTLREIARLCPRDPAELEQAHGIGPAKVARYGAELLAVLGDASG